MDNTEMEQGVPMEGQGRQEQMPPVDPKKAKEAEAYTTGLMKMLHSKETSPKVMEMLKSAPPEVSIPKTALLINQQMEDSLKSKNKEPSLETLLTAGVYLSQDLAEMGNAAGIFQIGEQELPALMQATMQEYIEKGLKDGSIDPVELQQAVAPLMDEEQTAMGMEASQAAGLPAEPDTNTAMEQYAVKREKSALKGVQRGGTV